MERSVLGPYRAAVDGSAANDRMALFLYPGLESNPARIVMYVGDRRSIA